ncbi:hypothetical protein KAW38_02155 [Candidatus Micrarchaeota archaeon]|nr:hypothetical protein [Candidatus Micrarchaeota archaeon]
MTEKKKTYEKKKIGNKKKNIFKRISSRWKEILVGGTLITMATVGGLNCGDDKDELAKNDKKDVNGTVDAGEMDTGNNEEEKESVSKAIQICRDGDSETKTVTEGDEFYLENGEKMVVERIDMIGDKTFVVLRGFGDLYYYVSKGDSINFYIDENGQTIAVCDTDRSTAEIATDTEFGKEEDASSVCIPVDGTSTTESNMELANGSVQKTEDIYTIEGETGKNECEGVEATLIEEKTTFDPGIKNSEIRKQRIIVSVLGEFYLLDSISNDEVKLAIEDVGENLGSGDKIKGKDIEVEIEGFAGRDGKIYVNVEVKTDSGKIKLVLEEQSDLEIESDGKKYTLRVFAYNDETETIEMSIIKGAKILEDGKTVKFGWEDYNVNLSVTSKTLESIELERIEKD